MSYIFNDDYDDYDYDYSKHELECEINGVRQPYDACSQGNLKKAISYYKYFGYIGTDPNGVIYIDGVKNSFNKPHHFFNRLDKKGLRRKKLKIINNEFDI